MSSRTILDNDFEFNNLHLNKLQFSDNSIQTTAYLGNSPLPSQVIYNIPNNTQLDVNFSGYSTILSEINVVNLHTGFISVLYFQNSTFNNIISVNLSFSDNYNGNLEITLLPTINNDPYYTTNFATTLTNTQTGTLTFGNIIVNKAGSLVASFNNVEINNTSTYSLSFLTCLYA
jgi:hypothetical protein